MRPNLRAVPRSGRCDTCLCRAEDIQHQRRLARSTQCEAATGQCRAPGPSDRRGNAAVCCGIAVLAPQHARYSWTSRPWFKYGLLSRGWRADLLRVGMKVGDPTAHGRIREQPFDSHLVVLRLSGTNADGSVAGGAVLPGV